MNLKPIIETLEVALRLLKGLDSNQEQETKRSYKLSNKDKSMIVKLYKDGNSAIKLAKKFGVHRVSIYNILKSEKVNFRNHPKNSQKTKKSN